MMNPILSWVSSRLLLVPRTSLDYTLDEKLLYTAKREVWFIHLPLSLLFGVVTRSPPVVLLTLTELLLTQPLVRPGRADLYIAISLMSLNVYMILIFTVPPVTWFLCEGIPSLLVTLFLSVIAWVLPPLIFYVIWFIPVFTLTLVSLVLDDTVSPAVIFRLVFFIVTIIEILE